MREETLKLITRFEEKGKDLLQRFLKDSHPEIRGKASLALAKAAKGQAVKPLTEIILSEDFSNGATRRRLLSLRPWERRDPKRRFPSFRKIAKKRRWFQKAKWDEMRQCASMALKMMGVSSDENSFKER